MDTQPRIGNRLSGNSKQDILSGDAARMKTLEKVDMHIQALQAKAEGTSHAR